MASLDDDEAADFLYETRNKKVKSKPVKSALPPPIQTRKQNSKSFSSISSFTIGSDNMSSPISTYSPPSSIDTPISSHRPSISSISSNISNNSLPSINIPVPIVPSAPLSSFSPPTSKYSSTPSVTAERFGPTLHPSSRRFATKAAVGSNDSIKSDRSRRKVNGVSGYETSILEESLEEEIFDSLENSELAKRQNWFVEVQQGGKSTGRAIQKYHPLLEETEYFLSYSHSSSNWDELTASLEPPLSLASTIPERVLDIGCSPSANWILSQAMEPGWEATKFVGLDLAPSLLPLSLLPLELSSRLSCVQRDFLTGLPFDDHSFDLVRISNVSLGVPESCYAELIEDVQRVLKFDGILEVVEQDFIQILNEPISTAVDEVFNKRFLNPLSLSIIPSALINNDCRRIEYSGRQSIEMAEGEGRVLLAAYAERMAGISKLISHEEASRLLGSNSGSKSSRQLAADVESAVVDWTEDLKDQARISDLLADSFDWNCTFDEKLEATLVSHIPILTARVEQDQAAILGDEDEDDNFRTLLFASQRELRDNAMELKEVSKRTERRDSTTSTLKFEFGKWRARRCPHIF